MQHNVNRQHFCQALVAYARYHQHPYNIISHRIGIPLIVLAATLMLATIPLPISAALVVGVVLGVYYLRADRTVGVVMCGWLAASVIIAEWINHLTNHALGLGVLLFVAGWFAQFVGHYFEGKKPAFFDDIKGLLIGPAFIVLEMLHALGVDTLFNDIERASKIDNV